MFSPSFSIIIMSIFFPRISFSLLLYFLERKKKDMPLTFRCYRLHFYLFGSMPFLFLLFFNYEAYKCKNITPIRIYLFLFRRFATHHLSQSVHLHFPGLVFLHQTGYSTRRSHTMQIPLRRRPGRQCL